MTLHSTTNRRDRDGKSSFVLASSTFALGVIAGVLLKDGAKHMFERARGLSHREVERTVIYDENMPEPLARREPAPEAGQQRFGGTGALGVSPASVVSGRPEEPKS